MTHLQEIDLAGKYNLPNTEPLYIVTHMIRYIRLCSFHVLQYDVFVSNFLLSVGHAILMTRFLCQSLISHVLYFT